MYQVKESQVSIRTRTHGLSWTDQTTEQLMPTKIHKLPLESPRAGILRA